MTLENPEKKKEHIHNPEGGLETEVTLPEEPTKDYAEDFDRKASVLQEESERKHHGDEVRASGVLEHLHDKAEHPGEGKEALDERTRERFQEKREGILEDKFAKGAVDNGLNLIPFVGGARGMYESLRGMDSKGEKLTGTKRIIHGALGAAAFAADFTGIGGVATEAFFLGKAGVSSVEGLGKHMEENRDLKKARILKRTARFMEAHPAETSEAQEEINDKIRRARTQAPERMAA